MPLHKKKTMLPDNKKVGFLIFTATKSLKDVGSSYDKFVLRGYYKILKCQILFAQLEFSENVSIQEK